MDLTKIPLLNAIVQKMDWLTERQGTIAQNISNADTPGYKAKSIEAPVFRDLLSKAPRPSSSRFRGPSPVRMVSTQAGHMALGGGGSRAERLREVDADSSDIAPNGNSVVLEEQMLEMGNTQMEYGMLISLYRKHVDILRIALGRN